MKTRDTNIIQKILSEIQIIEVLIDNYTKESFLKDEKTKRAVCMTLINIGELAKNITDELKSETDYIAWRGVTGIRDITAHKYQTLRMDDVWYTIVNDIPLLKAQLSLLISTQ